MTIEQVGYLNYGTAIRNPFNYAKFEQINRDVATSWLTLGEITQQLNLFDDESQDEYLSSLELAVRFAVEDFLGLSIFPVSYRVWYNVSNLYGSPVALDLPEVSQNANPAQLGVSIDSINYYNNDVNPLLLILPDSQYYYDPTGNKVVLNTLPSPVNTSMTSPIFCDYTTTANPLSTYPVIKQAGLLLLTHLYNNRSNSTDIQLKDIPFGFTTLLRPYKPLVM